MGLDAETSTDDVSKTGHQVKEKPTTLLMPESSLYQTLECGPDGQPGGILITSLGQQVIPGLWIGGYKAFEDRAFLRKNKIEAILTLGHFKQQYPPEEFKHEIIPIADNREANIIQFFPITNNFIEEAFESGKRILVHCLAGVSRSPTIVSAYLMNKRKLHPKAALAIIKQTRPFVNPNQGFMNQLRLYREMDYTFDPYHPAYVAYHQQHPIDAAHVGHEGEYVENTVPTV
ncbi:protein-tyrosine phosphatase-like protein [Zychaea mexicana]|uniref:protein-tyrosine phosphatase-like protein n=1 Tax=Zychaea mexicana TaxID=64656 RepID=UPI0022FDE087|nr:protein-tyrosine phosphatase-like protein [Zychaea mexicana]KAI9490823.1 protein-tyrosine phosphatase-like protein [Zychaea mexicana]